MSSNTWATVAPFAATVFWPPVTFWSTAVTRTLMVGAVALVIGLRLSLDWLLWATEVNRDRRRLLTCAPLTRSANAVIRLWAHRGGGWARRRTVRNRSAR